MPLLELDPPVRSPPREPVPAHRAQANAGIFFPEPLTLAYSEHLFAQAVQSLPVYAVTGSAMVGYNLVFLSTFALSGLGAYLLVRELTGNARAAFIGGLVYAFTPDRMAQLGHLQVLSSQWLPFARVGFRPWFDRLAHAEQGAGAWRVTWRPQAGAAAALVAQNLSCGYYVVFFAPADGAYLAWEIGRRALWRTTRVSGHLPPATVLIELPFGDHVRRSPRRVLHHAAPPPRGQRLQRGIPGQLHEAAGGPARAARRGSGGMDRAHRVGRRLRGRTSGRSRAPPAEMSAPGWTRTVPACSPC